MPDTITPADLRRYASDPMAFFADLIIPSARGPARFGAVMAGFQQERFTAIAPAFAAVARGEQPPTGRFVWIGTKGCGKDGDAAACLLWLLGFAWRPVSCMVGAVDEEQAALMKQSATKILRLNSWLAGRIEVQKKSIVCEATDSKADIVSTDVEGGSHGRTDDLTIINEFSHIPDSRWEAAATWQDNADKMPQGVLLLIGNAGFIESEAYGRYQLALDSPEWNTHEYNRPAPWLSEKHLADARRRSQPERFNRMFYGVWSHGTGDALAADDVEAAIVLSGPHDTPFLDAYVGGLDIGINHDRSAFIVLGVDVANERIHLAASATWSPQQYGGRVVLGDVIECIVRTHRALKLNTLIYDPTEAVRIAEELEARGLHTFACRSTPAVLDVQARVLLESFRNRIVALYRDEQLISDLYKQTIIERPGLGYRLKARRDKTGHADSASAYLLALPTAYSWIREMSDSRNAPPEYTEVYA